MPDPEREKRRGAEERPKGPPWCIAHNREAGGCGQWMGGTPPDGKKCVIVPHRPKEDKAGTISTEVDKFKGELLRALQQAQIPNSARAPAVEAMLRVLAQKPLKETAGVIEKLKQA